MWERCPSKGKVLAVFRGICPWCSFFKGSLPHVLKATLTRPHIKAPRAKYKAKGFVGLSQLYGTFLLLWFLLHFRRLGVPEEAGLQAGSGGIFWRRRHGDARKWMGRIYAGILPFLY